MADEQRDDSQETKVTNQVVDQGNTDESPAVGAPDTSSPEGEQSPAEAQRAAEGEPAAPHATAVRNTVPDSGDTPEGTGPGGAVRGGYGLGATGAEGRSDVRGPADTGGAAGGQSPMDAQRRADQGEDAFAEKPHLYVAGAFVGGLVLAQILKRLGGDND
jgi:hypothetical protein